MVLRQSTAVNKAMSQTCESVFVELWDRLRKRIAGLPDGSGREQAWLADKLDTRVQVVNNWLQREKLPASRYEQIAAAVGWSVDELLGKPSAAPTPGVLRRDLDSRLRYLSERDIGRLEHVIEQELDRIDARHQGVFAPTPASAPVSPSKKSA